MMRRPEHSPDANGDAAPALTQEELVLRDQVVAKAKRFLVGFIIAKIGVMTLLVVVLIKFFGKH